jgi:hypothetical protein
MWFRPTQAQRAEVSRGASVMNAVSFRVCLLVAGMAVITGECRGQAAPVATVRAQSQGVMVAMSVPRNVSRADALPLALAIHNSANETVEVAVVADFPLGKASLTNLRDGKTVPLTPQGQVALDEDSKRYRGQTGRWKLTKDKKVDATLDLRDKYQWEPGRYKLQFRLTLFVSQSSRTILLTTDELEFELTE